MDAIVLGLDAWSDSKLETIKLQLCLKHLPQPPCKPKTYQKELPPQTANPYVT
jgi:hypothetical protein